jgi:hypothetical protein
VRFVLALDGKTLRRSHERRRGYRALHVVRPGASANRLSLGQVAIDAESNQVNATPQLLGLLEIKGCIVRIDMMGCQSTIARRRCLLPARRSQGTDTARGVAKGQQPQQRQPRVDRTRYRVLAAGLTL